jgi:peptidoglycan/xylan/chitin deacetylase (PgdA/CDA1 family)
LDTCPEAETVAITFDDGHASNAWAAARLAECGGSADFFINPSTIGKPGFLTWSDLREMARLGMSIQSHGMTHVYLDDQSPETVTWQLRMSKAEIEARVGADVVLFAPPGGRQPKGLLHAAREAGYRQVCGSRPDLWWPGRPQSAVPRLAVLAGTSDLQWLRWIEQARTEFAWQRGRYGLLRMAKSTLGNQRYDQLRELLLGAHGSAS